MFVLIVFPSKEGTLDKSKRERISLSCFNILDPRILSLLTVIRSKHVKCRGHAHTGTEEATQVGTLRWEAHETYAHFTNNDSSQNL